MDDFGPLVAGAQRHAEREPESVENFLDLIERLAGGGFVVRRASRASMGAASNPYLDDAVPLIPDLEPAAAAAVAAAASSAPAAPSVSQRSAPAPQPEPRSTDSTVPQTGVEIVSVEKRSGTDYYTVRDLRNGNTVQNVTEKSARKLWEYAINEFKKLPKDLTGAEDVQWQGDYGLIQKKRSGKNERYDLAHKKGRNVRVYFGVTDDGIEGDENWQKLVGLGE